jgi:hypothetical protein
MSLGWRSKPSGSDRNRSVARLNRPHCRNKEALSHNTLDPTRAPSNSVARLFANSDRHKVGHFVDALEGLESPINYGCTLFGEDANLQPDKITDLKPILRHAERTYMRQSKFRRAIINS